MGGAGWEVYVFVRSTHINRVLSVLFIVSMGACGNVGGCGACGAAGPLPGGILPPNQTVEGGAQVRVTPQGFNKLTSILPGALSSAFGSGFTIPGGTAIGFMFGLQALGAAIGPFIGGVIADHYGLSATFYFLAGTIVAANVLMYFMPSEQTAPQPA